MQKVKWSSILSYSLKPHKMGWFPRLTARFDGLVDTFEGTQEPTLLQYREFDLDQTVIWIKTWACQKRSVNTFPFLEYDFNGHFFLRLPRWAFKTILHTWGRRLTPRIEDFARGRNFLELNQMRQGTGGCHTWLDPPIFYCFIDFWPLHFETIQMARPAFSNLLRLSTEDGFQRRMKIQRKASSGGEENRQNLSHVSIFVWCIHLATWTWMMAVLSAKGCTTGEKKQWSKTDVL